MERITPQIFYQYLTCPHWIWFDRFSDISKRGETNEAQQKLLEQGVIYEGRYMTEFLKDRKVTTITATDEATALSQTLKAMEAGVEAIYQGHLRTKYFEGVPDLLLRREGASKLGEWYYVPVDIKSSYDLKEDYKHQLMLYALMLGDLQSFEPTKAGIITVEGKMIEFGIEGFKETFFDALEKIENILAGDKPPVQLTKSCTNSPWYESCVADAEAADDIALLYKVDKRALEALRGFGIRTVEDARHVDAEAFGDKVPFLKKNGLERMKMQAESLKTKKIFLRRPVHIPEASIEIYFDIEGDPLQSVDYLFGVLICDRAAGTEVYRSFVAEHPEGEGAMWRDFIDWIKTLPADYVVFHYAAYEQTRMSLFTRKYGSDMTADDQAAVANFTTKLFDLNEIVKENFIFPLYFYGLKQICKSLGFSWRNDKATGVQSIFWYEEWLKTENRDVLRGIVDYNEDDVRATKFLKEWIVNFSHLD